MNEHSFMTEKPVKEDKSLRILDAAIRIFARKGFYNSTIADVAKVAEVAEGTIYLYFKNKDDLLISIFEHSMDLFIQEAQKELEGVTVSENAGQTTLQLHLPLERALERLRGCRP